MDQKTGKPAVDAKGKEIHGAIEFVPEASEGTVEVTFQFPGNGLEGHTYVVFEVLSIKKFWFREEVIAVHQDIRDEAQTLYVPKIGTTARDADTGMSISRARVCDERYVDESGDEKGSYGQERKANHCSDCLHASYEGGKCGGIVSV